MRIRTKAELDALPVRSGIDVPLKDIQQRATIEHKQSEEFPNVTECIVTFERHEDGV